MAKYGKMEFSFRSGFFFILNLDKQVVSDD